MVEVSNSDKYVFTVRRSENDSWSNDYYDGGIPCFVNFIGKNSKFFYPDTTVISDGKEKSSR
ncbi:hypothetical protein JFU50_29905 [Peribacillus sp. TH14]|nr:hypothetical protein [Peribacillus sp. TH14]